MHTRTLRRQAARRGLRLITAGRHLLLVTETDALIAANDDPRAIAKLLGIEHASKVCRP